MDQIYETNESQQPDNIVENPRVNVEILAKWIRVLFGSVLRLLRQEG